jgi:hypothetical protein
MPPACAIAMAIRASVTVSMADDMIGRLSEISRVKRDETSTLEGMTVECPGRSNTSSKVNASVNLAGVLTISPTPSSQKALIIS